MAHTFDPSMWEVRARHLCEFEASLFQNAGRTWDTVPEEPPPPKTFQNHVEVECDDTKLVSEHTHWESKQWDVRH